MIGVVDLGKRGGVVGVPTTLSEANGVRGCGLSNSAGALEQKLGAEDTAARDRCEGTGVIPSFDSLGRLSEELVTAAEPPRGLNGGVDPAARTGVTSLLVLAVRLGGPRSRVLASGSSQEHRETSEVRRLRSLSLSRSASERALAIARAASA